MTSKVHTAHPCVLAASTYRGKGRLNRVHLPELSWSLQILWKLQMKFCVEWPVCMGISLLDNKRSERLGSLLFSINFQGSRPSVTSLDRSSGGCCSDNGKEKERFPKSQILWRKLGGTEGNQLFLHLGHGFLPSLALISTHLELSLGICHHLSSHAHYSPLTLGNFLHYFSSLPANLLVTGSS